MKQLNDSRSIVANNVNYFTVHLNLKKMSPIPPILAISKQHISVGGPTNMERTNHVNTFDIKQNWKRIYSIFKARFLWRARETVDGTRGNQSLRGNFFFFSFNGRTFPRNRWWKLHHRFRTCGWGRRLNQKSKRVIVPFHVSVFINIHEKRNYYNSPGYITIQG